MVLNINYAFSMSMTGICVHKIIFAKFGETERKKIVTKKKKKYKIMRNAHMNMIILKYIHHR